MRRIQGVLDGINYHQFYLQAGNPADYPQYPSGVTTHQLIAASDPCVLVITGIAMGVVGLAIELLDGPPDELDDSRPWESVGEVSFAAVRDTAAVRLLEFDPDPPFDAFPLPTGAGWYRVRGHAIGRGLDYDGVVTEAPREHHLIQLWPAPAFDAPLELRVDDRWANQ